MIRRQQRIRNNNKKPTPRYRKEKKINSGSYGQVFIAWDTKENRKVVIKQVDIEFYIELLKEIHFLRGLHLQAPHYFPDIIQVIHDGHNNHLMMVMEYYPWTMDDLMAHDTDNIYLMLIFQQLMEAYVIMESHLIGHFDLKPDNVLIHWPENSELPVIKIIDLGFSEYYSNQVRRPYVCTDYYRPPEIFGDNDKIYGCEVDLWSIGVILHEYFDNEHVFRGEKETDVIVDIHRKMPNIDFQKFWKWHPDLGFIIQSLLNYDVENRLKTYLFLRPFIYENLKAQNIFPLDESNNLDHHHDQSSNLEDRFSNLDHHGSSNLDHHGSSNLDHHGSSNLDHDESSNLDYISSNSVDRYQVLQEIEKSDRTTYQRDTLPEFTPQIELSELSSGSIESTASEPIETTSSGSIESTTSESVKQSASKLIEITKIVQSTDNTFPLDSPEQINQQIEDWMLEAEDIITRQPELADGPPIVSDYQNYLLFPLPEIETIKSDYQTIKHIIRVTEASWFKILLNALDAIESLEEPDSATIAWSAFYRIIQRYLKSLKNGLGLNDLRLAVSTCLFMVSQIYYYRPLRLKDFLELGQIYLGWRFKSQAIKSHELRLIKFI